MSGKCVLKFWKICVLKFWKICVLKFWEICALKFHLVPVLPLRLKYWTTWKFRHQYSKENIERKRKKTLFAVANCSLMRERYAPKGTWEEFHIDYVHETAVMLQVLHEQTPTEKFWKRRVKFKQDREEYNAHVSACWAVNIFQRR